MALRPGCRQGDRRSPSWKGAELWEAERAQASPRKHALRVCGQCSAGRERGGSPVGHLVPPLPGARRCLPPSVAVVAKETPIPGQSRTRGGLHAPGLAGPASPLASPLLHSPLPPWWPPPSRPLPLSYTLLDGEPTLPAVVFLHGLFGSKTNFNSIARAVVKRTGRRVSFRVGGG